MQSPPSLSSASPAHPDLTRLLVQILALAEQPVPLARWRAEVRVHYRARQRTTRYRVHQAVDEAIALAGPDATTAALGVGLVAALGSRSGRASTTNGLLSGLRAACKLAVRRGYLGAARLDGCAWRVPDDPPRGKHHGRKEIARVLDWLAARASTWDGGRLHALASVYAYSGLRRMEALRLRVGDVDLARGFVWVEPNGGSLKTPGSRAPVPCPRSLVAILADWLPRCGSEWVFPKVARDGPWVGGSEARRPSGRLKAAGEAVGVEGFLPHSLRHSLATHLAGHWGLGSKQIRMVLRHTSERTQARYIHPDLANLGALVRGFDFDATPAPRRRADPGHALLRGRKRSRPRSCLSDAAV